MLVVGSEPCCIPHSSAGHDKPDHYDLAVEESDVRSPLLGLINAVIGRVKTGRKNWAWNGYLGSQVNPSRRAQALQSANALLPFR